MSSRGGSGQSSGESSLQQQQGSGGTIHTYEESFTPSVFSSPAHVAAFAQGQPPLHVASPAYGTAYAGPSIAAPTTVTTAPAAFSPYVVTPYPAGGSASRSHQLQQSGVAPPRSLSFGSGEMVTQSGEVATVIDTAAFPSSSPSFVSGSGSGIAPARQTSPRSYGLGLVQPAQSPPAPQAFTESVQPTTNYAAAAASPSLAPQSQSPPQSAPRPTFNTLSSIEHCSPDPQHPSFVPPQRSVVGLSSKRVPNRQEVARKSSLPLGMLVSPLAPMLKPVPCLRRPAVACATCGGYINKYCSRNFAKGEWKCVLCEATNSNQDEYADESCAQFPEFTNKVLAWLGVVFTSGCSGMASVCVV
jgi:hypothetical protein